MVNGSGLTASVVRRVRSLAAPAATNLLRGTKIAAYLIMSGSAVVAITCAMGAAAVATLIEDVERFGETNHADKS